MDPKLIQAILERIKAGRSLEEIRTEVLSVGHQSDTFEAAYRAAQDTLINNETPIPKVVNHDFEVGTIFSNSIKLARENLSLLGKAVWTFIALIVFTAVTAVAVYYLVIQTSGSSFSAFFASLAIGILFVVITAVTSSSSLLRAILHRNQAILSFKSHLKWAFGAFVAIIMISLYTAIITRVGYMFLVIPGLILNFYLIFSHLVLVDGEAKGMNALVVSMKMVYGRFWEVVLRLFLSILVMMGVFIVFMAVAPALFFLNPFFVPVAIILCAAILVASWYWQLCYMVVLYESLKESGPVLPLPVADKSLILVFRIVVGLAVLLLSIASFLLGFTAVSSGYLQVDTSERFWDNSEVPFDVELKMSLLESATQAEKYYQNNNTYTGVCDTLFINEHATCEEGEESYALEVPLSKGHYCIDSMSGNEVSRRSVIRDAQCGNR